MRWVPSEEPKSAPKNIVIEMLEISLTVGMEQLRQIFLERLTELLAVLTARFA